MLPHSLASFFPSEYFFTIINTSISIQHPGSRAGDSQDLPDRLSEGTGLHGWDPWEPSPSSRSRPAARLPDSLCRAQGHQQPEPCVPSRAAAKPQHQVHASLSFSQLRSAFSLSEVKSESHSSMMPWVYYVPYPESNLFPVFTGQYVVAEYFIHCNWIIALSDSKFIKKISK